MGLLPLLLALHLAHGNVGHFELRDAWSMGHRFQVWTLPIPGKDVDGRPQRLEASAAAAFADMFEEAARDGVYLHVTSAYRSWGQQAKQRRVNPRLAAKPGWSVHQQGRAIDVDNAARHGRRAAPYWWLRANAGRFGFYQPMSWEVWHWEFRGESSEGGG